MPAATRQADLCLPGGRLREAVSAVWSAPVLTSTLLPLVAGGESRPFDGRPTGSENRWLPRRICPAWGLIPVLRSLAFDLPGRLRSGSYNRIWVLNSERLSINAWKASRYQISHSEKFGRALLRGHFAIQMSLGRDRHNPAPSGAKAPVRHPIRLDWPLESNNVLAFVRQVLPLAGFSTL